MREEVEETGGTMRKIILVATVVSGVVAAYLMYKRGESLPTIARKALMNPVGTMVSEVRNAV